MSTSHAMRLLVAISLLFFRPARAADLPPPAALPQYKSDWQNPHGNPFRIRVKDNYAFVTNDETSHLLEIIDVSDPKHPVLVSHGPPEQYPPHYMYITGLALCADHAYVGFGGRVLGLDVSDKRHPRKISEWNSGGANTRCFLQADDHHLYVGIGGKGLFVVDVADPAAPRQVGFLAPPIRGKNVLAVSNLSTIAGRKYLLAMPADATYLVDVTDPAKPTLTATLPGMHAAHLAGTRLYSVEGKQHDTLFVRDLRDLAKPALLADEGYVLEAAGVDLLEDTRNNVRHLIVATAPTPAPKPILGKSQYSGRSMIVLNVEDPDRITEVGAYGPRTLADSSWRQPAYEYAALARSGDHTFAATYNYGLDVVDVSDLSRPTRVGGQALSGEGRWISTSGDRLYYSNTVGGVIVLDIARPFEPRATATVFPTGQLFERSHVVRAGCLYVVGEGERRMDVVDVRQPDVPHFMPPFQVPINVRGFRADAGGAPYLVCLGYVNSGNAERTAFTLLDVSKPFEPLVIKTLTVGDKPDASIDAVLDADVLYVATANAGIHVFDVKDKSDPRPVAVLAAAAATDNELLNVGNLARLDAAGKRYLYAASNQEQSQAKPARRSGLFVFDVTDPRQPVERAFVPAAAWRKKEPVANVMDMVVRGDRLYLADYWAGAFIFDVADPQRPRLLNSDRLPHSMYPTGIAFSDHALYVNRINGMAAYALPDAPPK